MNNSKEGIGSHIVVGRLPMWLQISGVIFLAGSAGLAARLIYPAEAGDLGTVKALGSHGIPWMPPTKLT